MNTTLTVKHQTASSGNKTITPAKSGRKTKAHTPRNPSRRVRGDGSPSRESSLRSGSFGKLLRMTGISRSTRTNHRTLEHTHTCRSYRTIDDARTQCLSRMNFPLGISTLPLLDPRVSDLILRNAKQLKKS